jgi:hypothetical protein
MPRLSRIINRSIKKSKKRSFKKRKSVRRKNRKNKLSKKQKGGENAPAAFVPRKLGEVGDGDGVEQREGEGHDFLNKSHYSTYGGENNNKEKVPKNYLGESTDQHIEPKKGWFKKGKERLQQIKNAVNKQNTGYETHDEWGGNISDENLRWREWRRRFDKNIAHPIKRGPFSWWVPKEQKPRS